MEFDGQSAREPDNRPYLSSPPAQATARSRRRTTAPPSLAELWLTQPPEPRPAQLTSVIRVGGIIAYPPPLIDLPVLPMAGADASAMWVRGRERWGYGMVGGDGRATGESSKSAAARGCVGRQSGGEAGRRDGYPLARADGSFAVDAVAYGTAGNGGGRGPATEPSERRRGLSAADGGRTLAQETPRAGLLGTPGPADAIPSQAHAEIRALVAGLVEVMSGRRSAEQIVMCLHSGVRTTLREWLQAPARSRYSATAVLRRVRLSPAAGVSTAEPKAIEAMALVQDGPRLRAVAFRFDAVESVPRYRGRGEPPRWQCTALQAA